MIMSRKYKIRDREGVYFITSTVIDWVDLFSRQTYRDILLASFRHCIQNRGLVVHAYVVMTNHFHAIVSVKGNEDLAAILRDLKKFTSRRFAEMIKDDAESRRVWLLKKFAFAANRTKRGTHFLVWQEGYHAKQLMDDASCQQALSYIHQNPVRAGWVAMPHHYLYSSASNYEGLSSLLEEVTLVEC